MCEMAETPSEVKLIFVRVLRAWRLAFIILSINLAGSITKADDRGRESL